ncbi:MAG TPA: hypothetical protein VL198_20605 [Pseudolabrys sp.]|nr:hypothetical protein [Pseudolabrys sp.]
MDKQLIVRLKKSERPEILTVQNSRDAKFFMANLRQIPSISHGRFRWLHCERNLALNQTYDNFGRAPHIRDRQKCKNGGYRPARDVSLEPTWHEIDAQADVVNVTTALTTKTINALMRIGKINLPLPP